MASINPIDNILNDLEKSSQEYLKKFPDQIEYVRGYEDALAEVGYLLEAQDISAHTFTVKLDTDGIKETLEEAVAPVKTLIDSLDFDKIKPGQNSLKDLFKTFEEVLKDAPDLADSRIPDVDSRAQDEYDAYQASVDNGFWDDAPNYKHPLFLEFIGNKLLLLVGEIIEAHEEIRNGRDVDEIYYPTNTEGADQPVDSQGVRHKPEGFLVELADLSIRLDDLVGYFVKEWGTPHLYEIKEEKREYNRSRGHKHGKKF